MIRQQRYTDIIDKIKTTVGGGGLTDEKKPLHNFLFKVLNS
jgi:hypothetical protein